MKKKADVIYDGLGKEAAKENYGGAHESFPDLGDKSGTLSRPVLFHYRRTICSRWPEAYSMR